MITFLSILGILLSLVVFGMTLAYRRFLNVTKTRSCWPTFEPTPSNESCPSGMTTSELVEAERARTREAWCYAGEKFWALDDANRCIYLLVEKYNAMHPTEVVEHKVTSGMAHLVFKARKDAPYRREG